MKGKTWLLLIVVLASALLAVCLLVACGGSAEPEENCAEGHDPRNTRTLRICTDKVVYDFGEPVYITFTVTNVSDQSLTWDSGDRAAMDICVRDECWSDEQELTPDLTRVTLEPGESRTLEWVWPTVNTDLKALERTFPPDTSTFGTFATGSGIPRPGASPRSVWVPITYRRP